LKDEILRLVCHFRSSSDYVANNMSKINQFLKVRMIKAPSVSPYGS
jgi:hypothetical protein